MLIPRTYHVSQIMSRMEQNPVVAIIGARQVGKTTITHEIATLIKMPIHRFDLEDPEDLARLNEPKLALKDLTGLVIIDEIQRKPELFPLLRVLADRDDKAA